MATQLGHQCRVAMDLWSGCHCCWLDYLRGTVVVQCATGSEGDNGEEGAMRRARICFLRRKRELYEYQNRV